MVFHGISSRHKNDWHFCLPLLCHNLTQLAKNHPTATKYIVELCLKLSRILTAAIQFLALHSADHPAIYRLISDAGIKGQAVVTTGRCAAGVRLQHLRHTGNGVASCPQLRRVGDGIAYGQRVDLSKVIVDAAVVPSDTHIPIPNAGVAEMTRSFFSVRCYPSPHRP